MGNYWMDGDWLIGGWTDGWTDGWIGWWLDGWIGWMALMMGVRTDGWMYNMMMDVKFFTQLF